MRKNSKILELKKLLNFESKKLITLKTPFLKYKIDINNKTYRMVIFYDNNSKKILPIMIYDKKDKKIGENLIRLLHKDLIIEAYEKNLIDIENNNYYIL